MKHLIASALSALFIFAASAQETKTETFKVYGNCVMCEKRIEKAARIDGVTHAEWNEETQMITISFHPSKTSADKVHKAIAEVGHDTDKEKTTDEVYKKLPGCCKYDRKTSSANQ